MRNLIRPIAVAIVGVLPHLFAVAQDVQLTCSFRKQWSVTEVFGQSHPQGDRMLTQISVALNRSSGSAVAFLPDAPAMKMGCRLNESDDVSVVHCMGGTEPVGLNEPLIRPKYRFEEIVGRTFGADKCALMDKSEYASSGLINGRRWFEASVANGSIKDCTAGHLAKQAGPKTVEAVAYRTTAISINRRSLAGKLVSRQTVAVRSEDGGAWHDLSRRAMFDNGLTSGEVGYEIVDARCELSSAPARRF